MELHWEFLIKNERSIRALCKQMNRGRQDLTEDLYSVCIERIPEIFKRYDDSRGASINTHVYKNLKWYLWKWMNRRGRPYAERAMEFLPEGYDVAAAPVVDLEIADEVNYILTRLSEYDRLLLMLYHLQGLTFQEIAEVIGIAKGTARNHYLKAMEQAREIILED